MSPDQMAKVLRVLSQCAHEIHASLEDAATDLELLAAEHEDGDQGDVIEVQTARSPHVDPAPYAVGPDEG